MHSLYDKKQYSHYILTTVAMGKLRNGIYRISIHVLYIDPSEIHRPKSKTFSSMSQKFCKGIQRPSTHVRYWDISITHRPNQKYLVLYMKSNIGNEGPLTFVYCRHKSVVENLIVLNN
jgi:hypothetical protein